MTTTKSAIRECRDQLFLDRAVGKYLSRVGSNLGMDRPLFGFHNDSLWRLVVRRGAVDYLQIANLFRDWLDGIVGPKSTVVSVLSADAALLDEYLMIADPTQIPRRGTVVLNEGLVTAQTFPYDFVDPLTGQMDLKSGYAVSNAVTAALNNAEGTLLADYAIGAVSLSLVPSTLPQFPIASFPYTLLIGAGTANEEVVQLTAHATPDAVLTVSATTKIHSGPTPSAITGRIVQINAQSVVFVTNAENFPHSGLIRLSTVGGATTEYAEFYDNDKDNGILVLKDKLTNTFAAGDLVTLMNLGEKVQLAQIQVKGFGWDLFQTEPRKIQIYLPYAAAPDRLVDASFLHTNHTTSASSTLLVGALAGDAKIKLVSTSAFPEAGALIINSGGGTEERIGYARVDRFSCKTTMSLLAGVTKLYVDDAKAIYAAADLTKMVTINPGGGTEEEIEWSSIDLTNNTITLSAPTANAHALDTVCEVSSSRYLYLTTTLVNAHLAGETVALVYDVYGSTDLEIGDPTVAPAPAADYRFQGHYLYYPGNDSRSLVNHETTLAENLPGPVMLMVDQNPGRTSIEVDDASLFSAAGAFNLTLSRYRGVEETVDADSVSNKEDVAGTTLLLGAPPGIGALTLSAGAGANFPAPAAGAPYDYRIMINKGAATEEVVLVRSIAGDVVTLSYPTTVVHLIGETVELLCDVICLSQPLEYSHKGRIPIAQRLKAHPVLFHNQNQICLVEELRTSIAIASLTNFPTVNGKAIINFGSSKTVADGRCNAAAAGATVLTLPDGTSQFPASDFMIEVDYGSDIREWQHVATNNVGLGQLTLSAVAGLYYSHPDRFWVRYTPGDQITVEYNSVATTPNRLVIDDGIYLPMSYMKGVPVVVWAKESEPSDYGTDYPLYLPTTWDELLKYLFDRGRAAGVEVVIITDK